MSLICYVTKIHFADGVLEEALGVEVARLGISRAFIVTDKGIVDEGILDRLQAALPPSVDAIVFDKTVENPDINITRQAANDYVREACDGIIGLGGGSSLDLAKMVGLLVSHGEPITAFAAVEGGVARIKDKLPPIIGIPTTAGTGSEVGRGAVMALEDGRNLGFLSPYLVPKVAICDPTLTLGMSPRLSAATGMEAIGNCIETYIATAYNPPADGISIDGLTRAAANIEMVVSDGKNIEARREMMAAAVNGSLAHQKGMGGVHAISHALGGIRGYKFHHGTLNAILLPHMLEFNAPAVGDRYYALKQAMGLRSSSNLSVEITKLNARIGLPGKLSDIGVDRAAVDAAAHLAENDHTNGTNPRKARATDYHDIMMAAL